MRWQLSNVVIWLARSSNDSLIIKGPLKFKCIWLLLKYISVNITNSSTVPYKYAMFIFAFLKSRFVGTLLKPRFQNILQIIFSLDDITSQIQKTKLCALPFIINCYMHDLAHNSITFLKQYYLTTFQMLIVIVMSEMFQQCLYIQERNDKRVLYKNLRCNCEQVPVVIDNEW